MNKKEASDYLGFSVKNLERLMAEKKIEFKHVKGKYGKEVAFDQDALDTYKASQEVSEVVINPSIITENSSTNPTTTIPRATNIEPTTSLTRNTNSKDSMVVSTKDIVGILKDISEGLKKQNQQINLSLGDKLTLSLVEASQLAGLSKGYIKKAIDGGELKAAKRGKGWNIKRSDLEEWVKGL